MHVGSKRKGAALEGKANWGQKNSRNLREKVLGEQGLPQQSGHRKNKKARECQRGWSQGFQRLPGGSVMKREGFGPTSQVWADVERGSY